MLNHYVFQTEAKKTTVVDPGRPLIIPAGADSLESIGAPAGATMPDITDGPLETRVAKFQRAVAVHFKPEPTEEEEDKRRDDEAGRWMEPTVDSMRAQKQCVCMSAQPRSRTCARGAAAIPHCVADTLLSPPGVARVCPAPRVCLPHPPPCASQGGA